MKRREFYKTYYRITDRVFCDRMIWSAADREQARRKGQMQISKLERKGYLAGQYLALCGAVWHLAAGKYTMGWILLAAHLLTVGLTEFSVIKMELLYGIYRRNCLFSELLYQNFLGKTDGLWCAVKPLVKSRVSGFARTGCWKLRVRYRVVFRKAHEEVSVIITPSGIQVQSKQRKLRLDDPAMPLEEAARRIAEELNA